MKKICLYCGQEIEEYEHYLDINGEILHEQCCYDKYGKKEGFDDDKTKGKEPGSNEIMKFLSTRWYKQHVTTLKTLIWLWK